MENWSAHHLYNEGEKIFGPDIAAQLQFYAQRLKLKGLPVVFSLNHLAKICDVPYGFLRDTVNRKREGSNYRMFAIAKRSGGRRFIHAVGAKLARVQTFINQAMLQECHPHPASFAFHPSGGIRKCAASHCGARFVFQFDLADFFYDVTETDVYHIFHDLGYRRLLAFELAALCTTIRLPAGQPRSVVLPHTSQRLLFKIKTSEEDPPPYERRDGKVAVLPQGAPSSPMLANLAALKLDHALSEYAAINGFVYTRYADDITVSATRLSKRRGRVSSEIVHLIQKSAFKVNPHKTRIAGPGSKKLVLGLLVDGTQPRLSRETYKRIDRFLHVASKYGLAAAADHFKFESAYGFHNHLSGLVAYVKDVDTKRWHEFSNRLSEIKKQSNDWAR